MLRELNRDVPPREEALPALELFETSVVARAVCGGPGPHCGVLPHVARLLVCGIVCRAND